MPNHTAETGTSALESVGFEPLINLFNTLPEPVKIGLPIAIIGVLAILLYKKFVEEKDEFETTSFKERIDNTYRKPLELQGGKIRDYIYKEASGNTKRLIGIAVKVAEDSAKIDVPPPEDSDDKSTEKTFETFQYVIIHGHNKSATWGKWLAYKVCDSLNFQKGKFYLAEYQEIPKDYIRVEDEDIVISSNAYLVHDDGLWRDASFEAARKVDNRAFITAHSDIMETTMQLGEIYAQLNTRVQGQLKLENIRSENIRKYKREERQNLLDKALD